MKKKLIMLILAILIFVSLSVSTLAKYVLQKKVSQTLYVPEVVSYSNETEVFKYTGESQVFVAPKTGEYFIELWGASGGGGEYAGNGAYTSGYISLTKGEILYIYVGSIGGTADKTIIGSGGYNGGGSGGSHCTGDIVHGHGGGGATDVRLVSGNWNDVTSLRSRIMVAAGGGGGYEMDAGGSGGGLIGYNTNGNKVEVATQTIRYFGIGQNGGSKTVFESFGAEGNCGGGGGYYGGGASTATGVNSNAGGGGGSSFISGHDGCVAIDENGTSTSSNIHFSNKYFYKTTMIDGQGYKWTTAIGNYVGIPNRGDSVNLGDGYAKISWKSDDPVDDPIVEKPTKVFTIRTEKYNANSDGKYVFEDNDGVLKYKMYDSVTIEANPEAFWYITDEGYIRNYGTNSYVYLSTNLVESQEGSSTYQIDPFEVLTSQNLGDEYFYKWTIQTTICSESGRISLEGSAGEAFIIHLKDSGGLNSNSKQWNSGWTKGSTIGLLSAATVNKPAWTSSCGRHWIINYFDL